MLVFEKGELVEGYLVLLLKGFNLLLVSFG